MSADARGAAYRPAANPTFNNPSWEGAALRLLIVRLSPFEIASRSFTHLFLAYEARLASPDVYIDFLFVPPPPGRELRSVAALRGVREFDVVLLSNAYLLELVNVPLLLDRAGIPPLAEARGGDDPLVILGGANATAAHALLEPRPAGGWSSAVDALYFGEGERVVRRLVEICVVSRVRGRSATLAGLAAGVTALWAPGLGDPPATLRRAVCGAVEAEDLPTTYPVLDGPDASTARLQISWGCPALCSFCFESYDRRPYREAPVEVLVEAARRLKRSTGAVRLEVFSFNFSTHAAFPELALRLGRLFGAVSFMSQRVDVLASNPDLLRFEIAAQKRTYTLGIEGISERLRGFLAKGYSRGDLDDVVTRLRAERVREVKLFFIITGYEEERDFEELGSFLGRHGGGEGAPRFIASFTLLLRMPFTPLRYDPPLLDRDRAEAIAGRLRRIVEERGMEFRLAGEWDEHLVCQLLAAGGHRARGLLAELAATGDWYDGRPSRAHGQTARRWLERGPDWRDESFPFEGVGGVPGAEALQARYHAAREILEGKAAAPRPGGARVHGVLDVRRMEEQSRERQRLDRSALTVLADLPSVAADTGPEWREAWLMREVLARAPDLTEDLLRLEVVPFPDPELAGSWYGLTLVRVVSWAPVDVTSRLASGSLVPLQAAGGWTPAREIGVLDATADVGVDIQAARNGLSAFLTTIRCAAVTSRSGESYVATAGRDTQRRRSLQVARLTPVEGGTRIEVTAGPRFPLRRFLDSLDGSGVAFRLTRLEPAGTGGKE